MIDILRTSSLVELFSRDTLCSKYDPILQNRIFFNIYYLKKKTFPESRDLFADKTPAPKFIKMIVAVKEKVMMYV